MNTLYNSEEKEKQLILWEKEVSNKKLLEDFLESDVYHQIFDNEFYRNYALNALERYVATGDMNYICKAAAPFHLKNFIQSILDRGENADVELKKFYNQGIDYNE